MLSQKQKLVFIHVPKVAGQSIESFFLNKEGLGWESRHQLLLRKNEIPANGPPRLAHLKAHEYLKYNYIDQDRFDNYFKFSFVRNPWSRMVSFYKYSGFQSLTSFDNFILKVLDRLMEKERWFYAPQHEFTHHKGKQLVNFIGYFETLKLDFERVLSMLDYPKEELPHVNSSSKKKGRELFNHSIFLLKRYPILLSYLGKGSSGLRYQDYYSNRSRKKVEALYEKDIELFNYQFEQ